VDVDVEHLLDAVKTSDGRKGRTQRKFSGSTLELDSGCETSGCVCASRSCGSHVLGLDADIACDARALNQDINAAWKQPCATEDACAIP
jgi:hypothetical protein